MLEVATPEEILDGLMKLFELDEEIKGSPVKVFSSPLTKSGMGEGFISSQSKTH
ncbi:protein of unknown function [Thermococcus nautili]|nr:protein of unknown function [Thermococcus nautili]